MFKVLLFNSNCKTFDGPNLISETCNELQERAGVTQLMSASLTKFIFYFSKIAGLFSFSRTFLDGTSVFVSVTVIKMYSDLKRVCCE